MDFMPVDVPQGITGMEEGNFTRRYEIVKSTAEGLGSISVSTSKPAWRVITDYLAGFNGPLSEKTKQSQFRQRTASEIIASRRLNGCTERALAFLALSREMRVPALYVETFEKAWLERESGDEFNGHIFVDLKIDGEWKPYETKRGFPKDGRYFREDTEYVEVGKGIDFSAVYVRQPDGTYSQQPVAIDGFPKLRELEKDFRARAHQGRF